MSLITDWIGGVWLVAAALTAMSCLWSMTRVAATYDGEPLGHVVLALGAQLVLFQDEMGSTVHFLLSIVLAVFVAAYAGWQLKTVMGTPSSTPGSE